MRCGSCGSLVEPTLAKCPECRCALGAGRAPGGSTDALSSPWSSALAGIGGQRVAADRREPSTKVNTFEPPNVEGDGVPTLRNRDALRLPTMNSPAQASLPPTPSPSRSTTSPTEIARTSMDELEETSRLLSETSATQIESPETLDLALTGTRASPGSRPRPGTARPPLPPLRPSRPSGGPIRRDAPPRPPAPTRLRPSAPSGSESEERLTPARVVAAVPAHAAPSEPMGEYRPPPAVAPGIPDAVTTLGRTHQSAPTPPPLNRRGSSSVARPREDSPKTLRPVANIPTAPLPARPSVPGALTHLAAPPAEAARSHADQTTLSLSSVGAGVSAVLAAQEASSSELSGFAEAPLEPEQNAPTMALPWNPSQDPPTTRPVPPAFAGEASAHALAQDLREDFGGTTKLAKRDALAGGPGRHPSQSAMPDDVKSGSARAVSGVGIAGAVRALRVEPRPLPTRRSAAAHETLDDTHDMEGAESAGTRPFVSSVSATAKLNPLPGAPAIEEKARALLPGWRRSVAALVDGVVVAMLVEAMAFFGMFRSVLRNLDVDQVAVRGLAGELTAPILTAALFMVGWSAVTHAVLGRTLGKLCVGAELIDRRTGERPSPARCVLRSVLSLLSLGLGGLGYFWIIVDREGRTLHDVLTRTVVVVGDATKRP